MYGYPDFSLVRGFARRYCVGKSFEGDNFFWYRLPAGLLTVERLSKKRSGRWDSICRLYHEKDHWDEEFAKEWTPTYYDLGRVRWHAIYSPHFEGLDDSDTWRFEWRLRWSTVRSKPSLRMAFSKRMGNAYVRRDHWWTRDEILWQEDTAELILAGLAMTRGEFPLLSFLDWVQEKDYEFTKEEGWAKTMGEIFR